MDAVSLGLAQYLNADGGKRWPGYNARTDGSPPHTSWSAPRQRIHFDPDVEFLAQLIYAAERPWLTNMAKKTQAERLMETQNEHFRLLLDETGTSYAVAKQPPYAAIEFKGKGALTRRLRQLVYEDSGSLVNDT